MSLSVIGVLILAGTTSLDDDRVDAQAAGVVHHPADRRLHHLHHHGGGRDEPRARSTWSRRRPSWSAASTPSTRVCASDCSSSPSTSTCSRSRASRRCCSSAAGIALVRTWTIAWPGLRVVRRQGRAASVLLHLAARDAAALALRPSDGLRLEGAVAGGDAQPGRHRRRRGGTGMRRRISARTCSTSGDRARLRDHVPLHVRKQPTIEYPSIKKQHAPRFHGLHELRRYADGKERCIGCELCSSACPANAITVIGAENAPDDRHSPGERYAARYEIDELRCIFCGMCEEACPTDAIVLTPRFEMADYRRGVVRLRQRPAARAARGRRRLARPTSVPAAFRRDLGRSATSSRPSTSRPATTRRERGEILKEQRRGLAG